MSSLSLKGEEMESLNSATATKTDSSHPPVTERITQKPGLVFTQNKFINVKTVSYQLVLLFLKVLDFVLIVYGTSITGTPFSISV